MSGVAKQVNEMGLYRMQAIIDPYKAVPAEIICC